MVVRTYRVEVFALNEWWSWDDIETTNIGYHLDRLHERYPEWKWRVESVAPTFELAGMDLAECTAKGWAIGGTL